MIKRKNSLSICIINTHNCRHLLNNNDDNHHIYIYIYIYISINYKRWQYLMYDNCYYYTNNFNDHLDNQSGFYHIQY